ncbi:versager [Cochliomyia hominivorax]
MDAFKVPKKVNRHVLKALNFLSRHNENVPTSQILEQVKLQMRNLVPVPNIERVIKKSLKNLSDIGLIERTSVSDELGLDDPPPAPKPNKHKRDTKNLFKPSGSRKRSSSELDPNAKRAMLYDSEDSLSGNEYERTRKRMRTNNKKVKYAGRSTELPKAKQHYRFKNITLARSSSLNMLDSEDDSIFEPNMEMAFDIGPKKNSNTDFNLIKGALRQPLEISEIFNDDNLNNLHNNLTTKTQENYSHEESAQFELTDNDSNSNNGEISNNNSKEQKSKTSVNSNQETKTSITSFKNTNTNDE